jgi:hypothetical protein
MSPRARIFLKSETECSTTRPALLVLKLSVFPHEGECFSSVDMGYKAGLNEESERQIRMECEFALCFEAFLTQRERSLYIDYKLQYAKEDFLRFLVRNFGYLLHGSPRDLDVLFPQPANDNAKSFGNANAVYAVNDPAVAIFFAIFDRQRFNCRTVSSKCDSSGRTVSYKFQLPGAVIKMNPWGSGVVHIISSDRFEQGRSDNGGALLSEWRSPENVAVWAKLPVTPSDFRFLQDVSPLDND